MFDSLSDKLLATFKRIRGQSRITEDNIQDAIKEIRLSLLEADVNFKVVKTFIDRVKAKALGTEVIATLNAGQVFCKIVHDELVELLGGGGTTDINLRNKPAVLFLVGLQGSGKTTSAAKLALFIRKKFSLKPALVSVDVYRPAAIDQLITLGKQNDLLVFPQNSAAFAKPEEILTAAQRWALDNLVDVVIVDTAGRIQIDEDLMAELGRLKGIWSPHEVMLVADAMLGQQSVSVAEGFNERLGLTGLILTKVDGDARGGAALSIREATGIPIKFLGVGEKVAALEVFHPDRLVSRILDLGDVVGLVEKAQEVVDVKTARESAKKLIRNEFTINDFLKQIHSMKKLGGLESMMKLLPGMGQLSKQLKQMSPPDDEIKKIEAIINSMTAEERSNHKILNGSRRLRIANGSGTEVKDVNRFIKQFEESKLMMSRLMKFGPGMFGGGSRGGRPSFPF